MTGSLFRRLLVAAVLLVAATLFTVDYTVTAFARGQVIANLQRRLTAEAQILADELPRISAVDLPQWVKDAAGGTKARVTVLNGPAVVIDSAGDRPAAPGEIAVTAPAAREADPQLALRLSATPEDLEPAVGEARQRIFAISLGAALVALCIALLVSRSLTGRVARLKKLAEGMLGDAGRDHLVYDSGDDLASLERSLGGVAQQLTRLVDRLRFESARREAILSGMAEGVLAVDSELRVTFCNAAFLRAVGFRGTAFEGLSLLELVRDPALHGLMRSVLASGEPDSLRFRLSAAHSRTFEVQATALDMPKGRGAIAILYDTTELERLEQVRKDFVANVSHELRTPLSGIIGYADTLLDGALEDMANNRRFVETIRSNAVRLGSIASDLLVLSELESGMEPPEPETISVRGVLDAALLTVEGEARDRGVQLIRGEIEDVQVGGSRLRLEQALLNLIANAVKFNRPGGEVRVSVSSNGDGHASIVISDTGVGIPSEDLPRIFERFYRVDRARSRQVGGTGLGLSIVKHVIERMNGSIRVESQLGKGTIFTVELPVSKGA